MSNVSSISFERIKKGDLRSYEEVYKANYENLCHYLLYYTQDQSVIEDVVQETFITLWRKRKEITIKTSLRSYLYRTAYNRLMDQFRDKKRTHTFLNEYYHTAILRAENQKKDDQEEQKRKLKACLKNLPKRCREVFTLSKFSGKTNEELAQELEISIKTVEKHITSGYKLLKECMGISSDS